MSMSWDLFRRSLVSRRAARRSDKAVANGDTASATASGTPLVFESLEPRLLLAADPLAAYAFNETSGTTTADATGHGLTGTLTSGPVFAAGKNGNGIRFDGVNDYVNLGNPTALRLTGSMTISAWINSSAFPSDDAAIVSKRSGSGFQLDTTVDTGTRTIGFKLTGSGGEQMFRYGATTLQPNTWYYVTGVYDATARTLHVYLNGQLDDGVLQGTVVAAQQNSTANVNIGRRPGSPNVYNFNGTIDDVRIYSRALTQAEIQADMVTPVAPPTPDTTAPTVPTGLAATPVSSTQVNLTWTASTDSVGVTGYHVFRDGVQIATVTTTSFNDTGRTPSTTYQYAVRATDAAGNLSALTANVPATTPAAPDTTAPTVPAGLAATPVSSTQVNLTWTASTDAVGVTGYHVFRNGVQVATVTTTSFNDTGRNPSTTYQYAVRATDAAGNLSALTANVPATTPAAPDTTAPTVPTGLAATPVSPTQVNLTWNASTDAVGVTGYHVFRDGVQIATVATTSFNDTGRNPSTTYQYAVRATDAAGNLSALTANVPATTPAAPDTTAPTVPTGLAATPVSSTQVNLTWTASTDAVGVTGYHVFRDGVQIATVATTSFNDTGRNPSTTYQYAVRATDAAGNLSALTANVPATTPAAPDTTAPTVPTGLAATPVSSTQVDLTWTASTDAVGVTGYHVFRDGVQIATVATTSFNDTGRNPSTTYQYAVRATDAAGNLSALTANVPATTPAAPDVAPPTVPTGLSATAVSSTQVDLTWTASTDNIGVTGYLVFRDGVQIATVTTTSFSDSGRTPSTTYQYAVRATDAAGNLSALTADVPATTPAAADTVAPTVSLTGPANGASVSGTITVTANAADNFGVAGVQFLLNGVALGAEDPNSPYSVSWDTTTVANGNYTLAARARDAAGNVTTSTQITVTVANVAQANDATAAYAFNETSGTTTADASGNGLTGTLTSGPVFAPGKYGNGIRFDGINDYVNLGNPTALRLTGSMTISAWINSSAFPGDDAAIVSKRSNTGFQLDTTVDTGARRIGFKLTNSSGGDMFRYGATTLQANTWYYVTGVYDATARTLHVYLNGQLDDGVLQGTVTTTQRNSTANVNIGRRTGSPGAFNFNGTIDDVRIYSRALTQAEIQADMVTPVGNATADTTAPTVPTGLSATPVSSTQVNLTWTASTDNIGVTGYHVFRDGVQIATVATTSFNDTGRTPGTTYQYAVRATDAAGNLSALTANVPAATPPIVDTTPPTVPSGLSTTIVSATQITLSWTASTDNVGVTGYQIFRDGVQIATVTTTVYPDGGRTPGTTYEYTVRATDAAGNLSALSTPISGTTPAADAVAPTVSLSGPADGATVSGIVTVTANAADNIGVTGVQFLLNGVALGSEDASSPYSVNWDTTTVANGSYTLAARARDAAGNLTTSTQITVTVANTQIAGLAAAYSFNETSGGTTVDATGHGITGTLTNGAVFAAGKNGNGVRLDGVNDFVNLGNPADLQLTGSMTISAWINSSAFPGDDAAIVSKRAGGGFQLDTTVDTGARRIGFKLTSSTGGDMFRYGATTLQADTWYYVTGVYDAVARTLHVYLNGVLDDGVLQGTVGTAQQNSAVNVNIGQRPGFAGTFNFNGTIDDVRIYSRALTQAEIQADMGTPVGGSSGDTIPPTVQITGPAPGSQVSNIITVTANAADNVGVSGVQFLVDGQPVGAQDPSAPYALTWDTRTVSNGAHTLTAIVHDLSGNMTVSAPITVNVVNSSQFVNEVLATGFNLPTAMTFLPDGRLLVTEFAGTIKVVAAPYTQISPTPFLQLTNISTESPQQGIYDIELDPNFATNHYYYIFYTAASPHHDRLSRFTANANLTGTIAGSEFIIYEDPQNSHDEHHGGAINFGNDGKIYLTTGEHFNAGLAQNLSSPRGKILRFNPDGTIPTDNPFYDGAGPNYDAIWAYGLRNPFRAYYDAPTGRLFVGDVGGNDYSTAREEINLGVRGANYGWPNVEGTSTNPAYTNPLYSYAHNGRDAAVVSGFVYHGTQFPTAYQGSYFFADYTQNWIRRLTFDANGNVNGVFNFEPTDGSLDGPYGDIVYLSEGPDGALYFLDLGYSDIGGTFGISKLRRISFINADQPPVANATATTPTSGAIPLTVNFSSGGSSDPEGQPLTYLWTFGDNTTSTEANPTHTYAVAGTYQVRLAVSDGTNTTLSSPLSVLAGNRPAVTIQGPADGHHFRAGDVITYSGTATDIEDGTLAGSAFTWNVDFLHEGHVHPGAPITGVTSGTLTIPTEGHDFSGNTRYRITLTVTDSSGLQTSTSVMLFPDKVNLTFDTTPPGVTLFVDGIARTGPFVYDTLIGFHHTIEARNQVVGSNTYTFSSWSDGGAQLHTIAAPSSSQTFTANYIVTETQAAPAFVQVASATPQSDQTQVGATYISAQKAGNTNIVAVGWSNAVSNITSVTDSAGNVYELAVPVERGSGVSQAIYFAKNVVGAPAGTNTLTVVFDQATELVDVRAAEYSGLDPVNPFDRGASSSGNSASASSGDVTTTKASELVFGAGYGGAFSAAGTGFTSRIITVPNGDIAEDRLVTTIGSYAATAILSAPSFWVMQVATFKAAGQA
jgi:chitodextrinase/glucose/arabinose dehydrogenase